MRNRIVARVLTLAAALSIAVSTTCVTAMAADAGALVTNTQQEGADSLYIMLSKEQHSRLWEAAQDKVSTADSGTLSFSLNAAKLDSKSMTLPQEVTTAEPLLAGKLTLTWQRDGGNKTALSRLAEPVQITIMLPTELAGSGYYVAVLDGSSYSAAADLDTVPNTVTFATASMGSFVVTKNAVATPKPAEPAPTVPTPPAETKPATGTNPKAGGIMDSYAPRTVLGQAVPISMPIPTAAPSQTGFSSNMAATSMLMTAAFVSGTIDYENSKQDEQPEEETEEPDDRQPEDSFDEDAEEGIEEELEGFREVHYR